MTWNGDAERRRTNESKDTSVPVVNDQDVCIMDHTTLSGIMTLAANGTQAPDEWLFIRDARSLVNAKQYRRAVIDAGTAAELAMTALIDRKLTGMNLLQREKLFEKNRGLWELSNLMLQHNAGPRRWLVERTNGWINHCRRLDRHYKITLAAHEGFLVLGQIALTLRRLDRSQLFDTPRFSHGAATWLMSAISAQRE